MFWVKNKLKGYAGLAIILPFAGAIVVALIGGYFGQSNRTDARVEVETNERREEDTKIKVNVAILQEAVTTIKKDIGDMKTDNAKFQNEVLKLLRQ